MSNELMTVAVYENVAGKWEVVFEGAAMDTKKGKTLYAGGRALLTSGTNALKVVVAKGEGEKQVMAGVGTGRMVAKGTKKDKAGAEVPAKVNAYIQAGNARVNVTVIGSDGEKVVPAGMADVQVSCNISL